MWTNIAINFLYIELQKIPDNLSVRLTSDITFTEVLYYTHNMGLENY